MHRSAFAAAVVAFALLALWSPAPANGATIPVTTLTDEINGDGDCSLREAIQSANTDTSVDNCVAGSGFDRIVLQTSSFYAISLAGRGEDANQTGDFDLTSDLEILGDGTQIVSGSLLDRVFQVHAGAHVTLRSLTIQDGFPVGQGGGIENTGSLVVDDCVVALNEGTAGGGIRSNGELSVLRSTISDNVASGGGGGISSPNGNRIRLDDTTVDGNSASAGGGLYVAGLDARRSTISHNFATNTGGGLQKLTGSIFDSMVNCTVSGNETDGDGGGVYVNDYAWLHLLSATITGNTADFDDVGAGSGGGLWVAGVNAVVELGNTLVAGNEDGSTGYLEFYIPDCSGDVTSLGYNFFGALNPGGTTCDLSGTTTGNLSGLVGAPLDPHVGPLADNGGATWTHALLGNSLAIDGGDPSGCVDEDGNELGGDQRRHYRVADGPDFDTVARCDIGAYEYAGAAGLFFCDFEPGTTDDWSAAVP